MGLSIKQARDRFRMRDALKQECEYSDVYEVLHDWYIE